MEPLYLLIVGAFQIAFGIYLAVLVDGFFQDQFVTPMASFFAPPSNSAKKPDTRPVTAEYLASEMELGDMVARAQAAMAVDVIAMSLASLSCFLVGLALVGMAVSRWNIHRQEAILITLLREKCAAELTPPPHSPLHSP